MKRNFKTINAFNDEELVRICEAADAEGWSVVSVMTLPMPVIGSDELDTHYTVLLSRPMQDTTVVRIRILRGFTIEGTEYRSGEEHMFFEPLMFKGHTNDYEIIGRFAPIETKKENWLTH